MDFISTLAGICPDNFSFATQKKSQFNVTEVIVEDVPSN
jgi:hypothetical protein